VLAVDQRGNGESALGPEEAFSIVAMVADLKATVDRHHLLENGKKIVLVGHSMGGRIAMAYAAAYPDTLAGVIIEDMDIKPRAVPAMEPAEVAKRRAFCREFPSWEAAAATLQEFGYGANRVAGWRKDKRVFQRDDGSWWSGINPMAQMLAREHVLGDHALAEQAWRGLASVPFPVLLFVAGKESACEDSSIIRMQELVPSMEVVRFVDAHHSIHNTGLVEFAAAVAGLYERVYTVRPGRAVTHDQL
jgi:pimeloyl-ACP methyl ester carboxylesterase